jgi:hypothetical protein
MALYNHLKKIQKKYAQTIIVHESSIIKVLLVLEYEPS